MLGSGKNVSGEGQDSEPWHMTLLKNGLEQRG